MRVAFFVHALKDEDENLAQVCEYLNKCTEEDRHDDICLFYNNVDGFSKETNFSMFNAASAWHFEGALFTTTLPNAYTANKMVATFDLFHIYNPEEKDTMQLLTIANDVKCVTTSPEGTKEFKRLTGKDPFCEIKGFDIGPVLEKQW